MKYLVLNHIPRCGGSSLKRGFYEGYKNNEHFQQAPAYISQFTHGNMCLYEQPHLIDTIHSDTLMFIDHSPSYYIEDIFKLSIEDTYRILTIRDPVKRVISHIHYFYGQHIDNLSENLLNNYLDRFGNMTIEYLTNVKYKEKSLKEKYEIAIEELKKYNFIFQVENQKLCEIFNDSNPFQLHITNHHMNRSPVDSDSIIGDKVKNIICNKIKYEIQLLQNFYNTDLII